MIRRLLPLTIALIFLAPMGWTEAQQAKPKKPSTSQAKPKPSTAPKRRLYRWVDANGQVQYTDSLPESALQQGRTELSSKTGQVVKQVQRALTPEELLAAQAATAQQAQQQALMDEQAKQNRVLLASYPDEISIQRSFQQQRELLQARVISSQALLAEQQRSLMDVLEIASELELKGTEIKPTLTAKVQKAAKDVRSLRASIELSKKELASNQQQEAETMAAWKLARAPATTPNLEATPQVPVTSPAKP